MRFSIRTLLVITALLSVALVCAPTVYRNAQWYAGVTLKGRGVSAWEANRWLPAEYRVPYEATDVYYYVSSKIVAVEFAASEDQFIEWSDSRGWNRLAYEPDGLCRGTSCLSEHPFLFGWGYDWILPGGIGFFDAEVRRVTFDARLAP
jgi:hypothetical protein